MMQKSCLNRICKIGCLVIAIGFIACNQPNKDSKYQKNQTDDSLSSSILGSLQGEWHLLQNENLKIKINEDSIFYFYEEGGEDEMYTIQIVSETPFLYLKDRKTEKGKDIWEEFSIDNNLDIVSQFYLLSHSDSTFVLMSTHSGQVLTYNRVCSNSN